MSERIALQGVTAEELAAAAGIAVSAARKLLADVHRGREPAARPGLPAAALAAAARVAALPALEVAAAQASAVDPFVKLSLRTADRLHVEAVRIPLAHAGRFSVCVSSQAGCALACAFCATGRLGLARNLEPWEIVDQVRVVRAGLDGARVHGVVFQGMGEPLANLDRVLRAIAVLTAPYAGAIDARAITVCTAGLPEGIRRLARAAPRVRLGLSIGSARPEVRRALMPISAAHPLADVVDAAAEHAAHTGLAPMWAITLLAGVNDGDDDADALAALARAFTARTGVAPRLTVLAYNRIAGDDADPFRPAGAERTAAFRDRLAAAGVHSHRRYSGGADIAAACGQLAG
ncbi:MAG TPA: radical SAM protein [Kofleriaceae bacterium]|nr:radical SAM protein [Kofleriaceae bacterium]